MAAKKGKNLKSKLSADAAAQVKGGAVVSTNLTSGHKDAASWKLIGGFRDLKSLGNG